MRNTASKVLVGLAALVIGSAAARATPTNFSVQGVLRDNGGALQSAMVPITIKIFNDQTMSDAANLLGTPVISMPVMAENGLFTVSVPVDGTLKAALVATAQPWLEVTAGADIFPRQPVSADVYALIASDCMSLGGTPASDYQKVLKTQNCTVGKYIQAIDADGNVTCANDANSGGTVTSISSTSTALTVSNGTSTPSLTVNGGNITGINGGNITSGTIPGSALNFSTNHNHGITVSRTAEVNSPAIGAGGRNESCATCPGGSSVVGGDCLGDTNDIVVSKSYTLPNTNQHCCSYKNLSASTGAGYIGKTAALCMTLGAAL